MNSAANTTDFYIPTAPSDVAFFTALLSLPAREVEVIPAAPTVLCECAHCNRR